jgi:hypothetical protein
MKDESERYAKSAAKQRQWWANMSAAEREAYERKRTAGMARYLAGLLRKRGRA